VRICHRHLVQMRRFQKLTRVMKKQFNPSSALLRNGSLPRRTFVYFVMIEVNSSSDDSESLPLI